MAAEKTFLINRREYRLLKVGEIIQRGDMVQDFTKPGRWFPAVVSVGQKMLREDVGDFARRSGAEVVNLVRPEPAKKPSKKKKSNAR